MNNEDIAAMKARNAKTNENIAAQCEIIERNIELPEDIILVTLPFICDDGSHTARVVLERVEGGIAYHSLLSVDGKWETLSLKDKGFYVNRVNAEWRKMGCPTS